MKRNAADGLAFTQVGPLRDGAGASPFEGEVPRGQFHFLWPSFGLNVFPGRPNLSCGPILPAGPERTHRFLDYFFAPDVDEAWVAELLEFDDEVGREDRALVEGVQRGMRTGLLDHGRLVTGSEGLIARFQTLTAEALGGRFGQPPSR